MSKLCVAYNLCPLIDQRSFLGVNEDCENGHVIVTLGKNIVIRYKLLNQKQINSWSSKDKFTSQVIFDKASKRYVSVVNQNQLRMWEETQLQLDKVKKIKFDKEIHCVLSTPDESSSLLVFQDGTVSPLDTALANRKLTSSVASVRSSFAIQDCQLIVHGGDKYVAYLSVSRNITEFHLVPVDESISSAKFQLSRENVILRGHFVMQEENICTLYTLWSDGKLFSLQLLPETQINVPGTYVQIFDCISTRHTVAMAQLDSNHFAMYGAHVGEEGAILVIFNTQYKLIEARQRSKLFGIAPRLWCIGTNLFVASGNFLSVVPFRLDIAHLAALVGSHGGEEHNVQKAVWGKIKAPVPVVKVPESLKARLTKLAKLGWSQCAIFTECLPLLIEKRDISSILWCLKNFKDIPEGALVQILNFFLSEPDSTFEKNIKMEVDAESEVDGMQMSLKKKELIDVVLNVPFADVSLLPYLRLISFSNTLLLLKYLSEKMTTSSDVKIVEWLGLMLDSHYQEYLLSKDPQVLVILNEIRSIVNSEMAEVEELKNMVPLLARLSVGKLPTRKSHLGTGDYSIEVVRLY